MAAATAVAKATAAATLAAAAAAAMQLLRSVIPIALPASAPASNHLSHSGTEPPHRLGHPNEHEPTVYASPSLLPLSKSRPPPAYSATFPSDLGTNACDSGLNACWSSDTVARQLASGRPTGPRPHHRARRERRRERTGRSDRGSRSCSREQARKVRRRRGPGGCTALSHASSARDGRRQLGRCARFLVHTRDSPLPEPPHETTRARVLGTHCNPDQLRDHLIICGNPLARNHVWLDQSRHGARLKTRRLIRQPRRSSSIHPTLGPTSGRRRLYPASSIPFPASPDSALCARPGAA